MSDYPKISIVTPCFNQVQYIEECMDSILSQHYPNLEYIVIDGGSTDGTVDLIRKNEKHLDYWVSEKDNGLYDALGKGFSRTTGDIMGWLNSDDILHRGSLSVIADIFANHHGVRWLQGYPTVIDDKGRIIYHRKPRSSKFSFYLKQYHDGIFVQQESTYWRRDLWNEAGARISEVYKYAGDFELWMRFFQYAEMYTTDSLIGAFRVRSKGQLSSDNYAAYLSECDSITESCISALSESDAARLTALQKLLGRKKTFPLLRGYLNNKINKQTEGRRKLINFDFGSQQYTAS